MMRWVAAAILFAMLPAAPAPASSRLDFNQGWLFRTDPGLNGETSGWTKAIPTGTQPVNVPHTWNIGEFHDYLGVAWYFRRFEMPPLAPGTHVELHFGATFYKARIWLNGVEVGAHEGGFTAYAFEISALLRNTNVLVVQIDNRPGPASIPGYGARGEPTAWYDWWPYGGIVRDVWLTETGAAWIGRQSIRSEVDKERAVIRDHVFLQGGRKEAAVVRVTAYEPDNRRAATTSLPLAVGVGKADIALSLEIAKPKLWSIDHPMVYRMQAELLDSHGKVLDERSDTFGLRSVEIKDRHLYLNGERVRLTGLARHEDSPWEGLAETRGTMKRDFDDMKALHATLTRPVHYPQNPYILDYADRHGIMLIPEIPVWQFSEEQLADPKVLALAKQQMQEMIEQAGNHPSIFAWSVANESATGTPGGIAYFRSMREFIRKLDPGRYVSFADDNLAKLDRAEQSAANDADFLMMNQYYGTWHGPTSALIPALDKVNQMFPNKMVIISEFGYPGFFASSPPEADPARIRTIQDQMPLLAGRDWIAGAILWCYQDYKSRRNLWPGQTEGYVEHGVVDEARQRKPSYDVWRELNEPARIEAQWVGPPGSAISGFAVTLTPHAPQDLPYYPLHHYTLVWKLVDEKGKRVAGGDHLYEDLSHAERLSGAVPAGGPTQSLRLSLSLLGPLGAVASERTLDWPAAVQAQPR
jgi:hypothetical protein